MHTQDTPALNLRAEAKESLMVKKIMDVSNRYIYMYVYIYIQIYTYIYTYIHVYISIHIYMYIHTYIHVCTCTYRYIRTHI